MICVETYPFSVRWILISELTDYWRLIIDLLDHVMNGILISQLLLIDLIFSCSWSQFTNCHMPLIIDSSKHWELICPNFHICSSPPCHQPKVLNWISHDFSQVLWLFIFDVIFNNIPIFDFNSLISHACPRKASQEKKSLPMAKYLGNRKSPIIKKVLAHKTWETTFCHCYI